VDLISKSLDLFYLSDKAHPKNQRSPPKILRNFECAIFAPVERLLQMLNSPLFALKIQGSITANRGH
jgi:hypothetical protein